MSPECSFELPTPPLDYACNVGDIYALRLGVPPAHAGW